jgi:GAF domain-containing protein
MEKEELLAKIWPGGDVGDNNLHVHISGLRKLLGDAGRTHLVDILDSEGYRNGIPNRRAWHELGGARTTLVVALRRDASLLGAIMVYRQEVRPFSDTHVALLQNFAAQITSALYLPEGLFEGTNTRCRRQGRLPAM